MPEAEIPLEARAEAADGADGARLTSALLEEAWLRWSEGHARALLPRDAACVVFRCRRCGAHRSGVFAFPHSPYLGEVGGPLYRDLEELLELARGLLEARHPLIPEPSWEEARACACGVGPEGAEVAAARLLRHLRGSGQDLLVDADRAGLILRIAQGGRAPAPAGAQEALELELDLFAALRAAIAPDLSEASGARGEHPALRIFAVRSEEDRRELERHLEGRRHILLRLGPELLRAPAWPAGFSAAAEAMEAGALALCLVLDRAALLCSLRALARPLLGARVEEGEPGAPPTLRAGALAEQLAWPLRLDRIALDMARYGRTLEEAGAAELERAASDLARVEAFLAACGEGRPHLRFELEGLWARPIGPEGPVGRAFSLQGAPLRLDPVSEEGRRELRFLLDPPDPWADPSRVCPCGAACGVELRLASSALLEREGLEGEGLRGEGEEAPRITQRWGEAAEHAAAVVAFACDLHVRFPPIRALRALGLEGEGLARRLRADLEHARYRARLRALSLGLPQGGGEGEGVGEARGLLAEGQMIASVLLEPALVAGLLGAAREALGLELRGGAVRALAITPNHLVVCEDAFDETAAFALLRGAAIEAGLPPLSAPPFHLTRSVAIEAEARGSFFIER